MQYTRLYADAAGESRFEDVTVEAATAAAAAWAPAERYAVLRLPAGLDTDWHPAPRRRFGVILAGACEVEASAGGLRRFGPGDALAEQDTTGTGHRTRVPGPDDLRCVVLDLPE